MKKKSFPVVNWVLFLVLCGCFCFVPDFGVDAQEMPSKQAADKIPVTYKVDQQEQPRFFPGEIIVKFKSHVVKKSFRPIKEYNFDAVIVDKSLTGLQRKYKVSRMKRFLRHTKLKQEHVYILSLGKKADLEEALKEYARHPLVDFALQHFKGFPDRRYNRKMFRIPGEMVVKFKPSVVQPRNEKKTGEVHIMGLNRIAVSKSLQELHRRFSILAIERYFRNYEKRDRRTGVVSVTSAAERSKKVKKRFSKRRARIPKAARIPDLENIFLIKLPYDADIEKVVKAYQKNPAVQYAQPHFIEYPDLTPNDYYWDYYYSTWDMNFLWGLERIEVEQAWDVLDDGSGVPDASSVVVAVADSGTDYTHEDLDDNIWVNPGEVDGNSVDDDSNGYIDDIRGWDFVDDDNDPSGSSHGTHVAGTVAAEGNNTVGIVGVTWNAKIMPLRKSSSSGPEAIQYAADNGADVINNSWYSLGVNTLLIDAVDYAHALGVVVVASAGNRNCDTRTQAPAQAPNAVVVSNFNYLDQKKDTSNYGIKVDVAAPGTMIYSTYPSDGYGGLSGTSMSAPHVSGLAALILAYDASLTNEQVRQVIRTYADDMADPLGDGSDYSGHDIYSGYGRINARSTLEALAAGNIPLEAKITSPLVNFYHSTSSYYDHNDQYIYGYFARTQVSGNISIEGVADGPDFQGYTLEYGSGQHPTSWTTITSSVSPVSGGVLGTLDTDALPGGTYTLRLTVENTSGQTYEDRAEINVDRAYITYPTPGQFVDEEITVTGFATGSGFVSYHFEYGEGEEPAVWNIIGSTFITPVEDDVLLDPLPIDLLPNGLITLKLVVTEAGGTSEYAVPVVIDNTNFPYQSGWPVEHGVSGVHDSRYDWNSAPAAADLDADGQKEVVVGFYDQVYVHQVDGSNRAGWPVAVDGNASIAIPAVGDIDDDGYLEIGIKTYEESQERVYLFDPDGSILPGWPIIRPIEFPSSWERMENESAVVFEDMDGDGVLDVVFGTFDDDITQGQVRVYRADGTAITGWPQVTSAPVVTTPAVGDLDGDWLPEVVALTNDGHLYAWDREGNLLPNWPQDLGSDLLHHSPLLVDLDGDGDREIVAANYGGNTISVYHHDGTAMTGFPQTVDLNLYQPGIGDLDGDGDFEIIVTGSKLTSIDYHTGIYNYALEAYAFNPDGTQVSGWNPKTFSTDTYPGFPLLADLDEDGITEVIITDWNAAWRDISGLETDGTDISDDRWPIRKHETCYSPLSIEDLDGDGDIEVIFAGYKSSTNPVNIWDLPSAYNPANIHWGTAHHDPRRTNLLQFDASALLLFDTSGSMSWAPDGTMGVPEEESRLQLAREAIEPFLVLLNDYNGGLSNVGIATFPQHPWTWPECESELVLPMRRVTDTSTDYAITTSLPDLEAEGSTPLLAGLERAANMFGLETHRALILLSDGYHNCPSTVDVTDTEVTDLIERLNNRSITAYTIGFGRPADVDHPLLETIASETGGSFYDVTVSWPLPVDYDPAVDLAATYKSILADVMDLETPVDPMGTVGGGETVTHEVRINEHDRRVSVFLSWVTSRPDRLGLAVKTSDGNVIPANGPGIRLHKGNTYTILTLERTFLKRPGKVSPTPWQIEISGTSLEEGEKENFQYSVITDSALKMKADFDKKTYATGEEVTLFAHLTETGKPLTNADSVFVEVTRPQDGFGNWFAAHTVTREELSQVPEQQGDEILFPAQRKAIYLTNIRNVPCPGRTAPIKLTLHDDGTHGDKNAGDGIYTNRFTDTVKEGTYSFHFHASGTTRRRNPFEREDMIQKYITVNVEPGYTSTDVVTLPYDEKELKQFNIIVTPKDYLGNYLGPRYSNMIKLAATRAKFIGELQDNLDGTYSQVLQLPPGVDTGDVIITVDIKGKKLSFNLAEKLQKPFGISLHPGITIPTGNFNNSYNPGYSITFNVDYHIRPQLSVVGLVGLNYFNSGSSLFSDTHWWNISANMKYEFTTNSLRPYLKGGPGLYIPKSGPVRPGYDVGVGLDYSFTSNWTIGVGTDYNHVFFSGSDIQFLVSHIGLIYRF